jgi:hypothetical protein
MFVHAGHTGILRTRLNLKIRSQQLSICTGSEKRVTIKIRVRNINILPSPLAECQYCFASVIKAVAKEHMPWKWVNKCDQAFNEVKRLTAAINTYPNYLDPSLPLVLATDARPYGIGAVLSSLTSAGEIKPIHFASRTLSKAEQNYSQLDLGRT